MLHQSFMDTASGPIGRAVTSEEYPATAHEFYFWTAETETAQELDIGHIVAAESEDATAIAVLDDPRRYSDLASFLDDFYAHDGDAELEPLSERVEILVFRAQVLATRHREHPKKSKRPVKSGPVHFATSEAIEFALGSEEFSGTKIPMLLHENGNEAGGSPQRTPLYVDEDYLLGPEAGHLNITGMSGLSTKTSHALFTTSSIFQKAENKTVAALMFNVKSADLLFLDKPAEPPEEDPEMTERYRKSSSWKPFSEEEHEMYGDLGLAMEPFDNLRVFAPLRHGVDVGSGTIHPNELSRKALNTLRNAPGESEVVHPIVWTLGDVLPLAGRLFEQSDYDDKFRGFIETMREEGVTTFDGFYRKQREIDDYLEERETPSWRGHNFMTIAKARNRFNTLPSKCGGLLVPGAVDHDSSPHVEEQFTDREMRVVDISGLSGTPQDLVVTRVIDEVWERAEKGQLGVDKLIIFVDELNKYAPSGSRTSPLKDTLVDISARGRHLSLTLFGAQQFRSKVDDEVVGNAATSLYGRIGDEELTNSSYRSFSGTTRDELLQLEKGGLLLRHAHYAVPVFGRFPRPPVLMGKQGTDIFGGESMDLATEVHSAIRSITGSPPAIQQIRTDIEGVPEDRVRNALDKVMAVSRNGSMKDPYRTLKDNLQPSNGSRRRSPDSRIIDALDRFGE